MVENWEGGHNELFYLWFMTSRFDWLFETEDQTDKQEEFHCHFNILGRKHCVYCFIIFTRFKEEG